MIRDYHQYIKKAKNINPQLDLFVNEFLGTHFAKSRDMSDPQACADCVVHDRQLDMNFVVLNLIKIRNRLLRKCFFLPNCDEKQFNESSGIDWSGVVSAFSSNPTISLWSVAWEATRTDERLWWETSAQKPFWNLLKFSMRFKAVGNLTSSVSS